MTESPGEEPEHSGEDAPATDPTPKPPNKKLGRTSVMLRRAEQKVSNQWRRVKGKLMGFSAGFAWKRDWVEGKELEPEVTSRERPTGHLRATELRRRRRWVFVVLALAVCMVGAATWFAVQHWGTTTVETESLF